MKIEKCKLDSFAVIGKEGATCNGEGFINKLWEEANAHFEEVAHLAARDEYGNLLGMWGAMTDMSRNFRPWEDEFTRGLYLAGIQCEMSAKAPEGWTKWIIPSYEYLYVECEGSNVFSAMIQYMEQNQIPLAGAVHDFIQPRPWSPPGHRTCR